MFLLFLLPRIGELRLSLVFVESQFWVLHIMEETPIFLGFLIVCSHSNVATFFKIFFIQ